MNRDDYKNALTKIAWAYILIYFDFNVDVGIGTMNILPKWAGYIMILTALNGVAEEETSAKLLRPFGLIIVVEDLLRWTWTIFGGDISWPWISTVVGVINLYFHFQLLTNLADIAERDGSAYTKRLRLLRTFQTIFVTIWIIVDLDTVTLESSWPEIIMGVILLVLMVGLVTTLFAYKNEPTFDVNIPGYVQSVLDTLTEAGHEAYVVGGCVRDILRGDIPKDWDVCTSALPEETLQAFVEQKTIETGLKHGTVTVLSGGNPVEVTTYRIDGEYLDSRHPEKVEFTRSLEEDLARRDFTINAMAYHPSKGIIDLYQGCDDLNVGLIRCVGNPSKRFQEDALRIMRGLRFSSVLDFGIEPKTDMAMRQHKEKLQDISKERINVELSKLLLGQKADQVITAFLEVLETAAPGMQLPSTDLNRLPYLLPIRLAAVFPKDTETCLRNLKYDNDTIKKAAALAELAGEEAPIGNDIVMKKFLRAHGERVARLHYARAGLEPQFALETLLEKNPCYCVKDLVITGTDLIEMGLNPGPEIGRMLEYLLDEVIEENVENERAALLDAAKEAANHE